jgi:DNA mismatch endonuclease (patch repair protein)
MTREQRSRTMSRIRSKNTQAELILRRALSKIGLRYRIHSRTLPGSPDIVFGPQRIAVFVDGDFWHGRNFTKWAHKLTPQWRTKIEGNRARDRKTTRRLRATGWTVIRIWERHLKSMPEACAERVLSALRQAEPEVNFLLVSAVREQARKPYQASKRKVGRSTKRRPKKPKRPRLSPLRGSAGVGK